MQGVTRQGKHGRIGNLSVGVREYGCGVVAEEFSVQSMAKALSGLSAAEIDECKKQSDRAAHKLCFEKEREKMIALISRLLERKTAKSRCVTS